MEIRGLSYHMNINVVFVEEIRVISGLDGSLYCFVLAYYFLKQSSPQPFSLSPPTPTPYQELPPPPPHFVCLIQEDIIITTIFARKDFKGVEREKRRVSRNSVVQWRTPHISIPFEEIVSRYHGNLKCNNRYLCRYYPYGLYSQGALRLWHFYVTIPTIIPSFCTSKNLMGLWRNSSV